jgi:hypothetical protein
MRKWVGNPGEKAAELFPTREAEGDRDEATLWAKCGVIRLHLGDQNGYREACAQAWKRFGSTTDPETANNVAWLCAQAPDAVPDLKPVVRLMEAAVQKSPNYNSRHTLGYVYYRAGRIAEAQAQLAIALDGAIKHEFACVDWGGIPMAMHRSGQIKEARTVLETMKKSIDPLKLPLRWQDRLEYQMHLREAEEVLKAPPPKETPKPGKGPADAKP